MLQSLNIYDHVHNFQFLQFSHHWCFYSWLQFHCKQELMTLELLHLFMIMFMASISSLTQQVWVSVPVHHWIISHHELLWFRRSWSCIKSAMTDLFSSVVVARWEKITSLNCSCLCELGCLSNPGVVTLQFLPPKQVYDWINIAAVPQTHFSGLDLLQATGTNTPSFLPRSLTRGRKSC